MKNLLLLILLFGTGLAHGQNNLPLNLSPTPVRLYPGSPASLSAAYTATGSPVALTVTAFYDPGDRALPAADQPALQVLSDRYILSWNSTQTARQPARVWLEIKAATTIIRAGYVAFERSILPVTSGNLAAIGIATITLADIIPLNTGLSSLSATMALRLLTSEFSSYSATTAGVIAANTGNIATHTGQLTGLTSATALLRSDLTNTTTTANSATATGAANTANIAGLASATATLATNQATNTASISTHSSQIAGLQSATTAIAGNVATNTAAINTHTGQLTGLQSATANLNSAAITSAANITGLASATATLSSNQAMNTASISTHTGQIGGLVSATASLDSRITSNTNSGTLTAASLTSQFSMSALRAQSSSLLSLAPTSIYITDKGREGVFVYDPIDTSTADDGAMTIVASGRRYKKSTLTIDLETFGGVADGNPATGAGTINNAALIAALTWLQNNGGGTLQLRKGTYRLTQDVDLPAIVGAADNNGGSGVYPMHPLRLVGVGHHSAGEGAVPLGGSILMWTAGSGRPARIVAKKEGLFSFSDLTFISREGTTAGSGRPFILTTNTTVLGTRWAAWTQKSGGQCDDDFIVLGGTSTALGDGDNAPFQGYSTVIENGYMNGIRRGFYARTYANANRFVNNNFWNRCGSNLSTGQRAAIEVHGDAAAATGVQYAVGNVITGNLIEISGAYDYGIRLSMASQTQVWGNDCYDPQAQFVAAVRLEATAIATNIIGSLSSGKPYVSSATATNYAYVSGNPGEASVFDAIQAGNTNNPNVLGRTLFQSVFGTPALTIKPTNPATLGSAVLLSIQRAASESAAPGGVTFEVNNAGGISLDPAGVLGGVEIKTGGATQASFLTGLSKWTMNGSGTGMEQNSGSGGSYFDMKNYAARFFTNAGTLVARVGNLNGSNGLPGIQFGTASDVELYRSATGALRTGSTLTVAATVSADAVQVRPTATIALDPGDTGLVGQLTTAAATGASFTANLRNWAANGAGSQFLINTGSGGSYLKVQAYGVDYYDHTGAAYARMGNLYGGNGYPGIGFGAARDADIYRKSAGILATSAAFSATALIGSGTTPTVSVSAPAGTGATVTVVGTAMGGTITLTTGTAPTAGTLFTLTFATAYSTNAPVVVISPSGGTTMPIGTISEATTGFAGATVAVPTASTTYKFNYVTIGR